MLIEADLIRIKYIRIHFHEIEYKSFTAIFILSLGTKSTPQSNRSILQFILDACKGDKSERLHYPLWR